MFGELHSKRMTPVKALILQSALTSLMVIVGDFSGLVMFYGVVGWSWYFVFNPFNYVDLDHCIRGYCTESTGTEIGEVRSD
jgi:hypothetical protein